MGVAEEVFRGGRLDEAALGNLIESFVRLDDDPRSPTAGRLLLSDQGEDVQQLDPQAAARILGTYSRVSLGNE